MMTAVANLPTTAPYATSNMAGVGGSFFGLLMAAAFIFSGVVSAIDVGDLTAGLAYFNLFSHACQASASCDTGRCHGQYRRVPQSTACGGE